MLLTSSSLRKLASLFGVLGLAVSTLASGHAERAAYFPQERVSARPEYRPLLGASGNPSLQSPRLVVCKKSNSEGVEAGKDSAALIRKMPAGGLKKANEALLKECRYEHLQAAVDAVTTRGTNIYVLPGLYREQPSIRALEQNYGAAVPADRDYCQAVLARGPGKLTYEEQFRCRFIQNTVAIFGDPNFTDEACGDGTSNGVCAAPQTQVCDVSQSACQYYDLQIEGTGEKITDVIFEGDFVTKEGDPVDGHFRYLNGIRADRTDGIYLRNFTTQIYEFNAVYVMEVDGYVLDRLLSRWVDEYAFLSFASDHGLYDYTEGYGVADSVQYPGSGADVYKGKNHAQADLRARQATEVRNSKGHHSALGYSGTAGNSPWVHNNEFYKNQTGMATESVYGGHPGMPQDHALWEDNLIYSNNKDYYKYVAEGGPCIDKKPRDRGVVPPEFRTFDELPADHQEAIMDRTIVCPPIPFPTGTAMIIAGGNYDVVQNNQVFDNWRQGLWLLSIPTLIHKLTDSPASPLDPVVDAGLIPDPAGLLSTVNDALGAVLGPNGTEAVLTPVFTAHYNRVLGNHFGESPFDGGSRAQPNGVDIWWDNSGVGNCFEGNTAHSGEVTSDLGPLGVTGLPGGPCADATDPSLVEQVATVRPDRLVSFLTCLEYNRDDPASKSSCPFFTETNAPAGRVGSARVSALQPSIGVQKSGMAVQSGYFVLHNDTGETHRLKSATVRASGPVARLDAIRLSINGHSANASIAGDQLSFSFAEPVEIERIAATLAQLETGGAVALAEPRLMLASLGTAGGFMLLMVGGLRRRERAWLVAAMIGAALLAGCGGRSDGVEGGNGPRVKFELTSLQFEDGAGAEYSGLPLTIGEARLP
ncbi:MAG TPA: hypothetical protein VLI06_11165 [Solimonas sp.]|nr:hypothetical protein [Solimonas sp.]